MAPRRSEPPPRTLEKVAALVEETARLSTERAKIQALARGGLIAHFQDEAKVLPIPEDQARRDQLVRTSRRRHRRA